MKDLKEFETKKITIPTTMKEIKEFKRKYNMKEQNKWFKWRYLLLWTFLFNWIGTMVYLIQCGNKLQQEKGGGKI